MKLLSTILCLLAFTFSTMSLSEPVSTQELPDLSFDVSETSKMADSSEAVTDDEIIEDDFDEQERNEQLMREAEAQQKAEAEKLYLRLYAKDLNRLKDNLLKSNYIVSLELLNQLSDKVKLRQTEELSLFFPKQLEGFKAQNATAQSDSEFVDGDYGVLFTRKYRNSKGHSLEFNIVFSDQSINDFLEIVRNPNLVQGMKNTSIVSVQQYKALETISDDNMYFERNIVLNTDLMITVVGIGVQDRSLIQAFFDDIHLNKIETYFKK